MQNRRFNVDQGIDEDQNVRGCWLDAGISNAPCTVSMLRGSTGELSGWLETGNQS
jgi:hypothetical protein